MKPDICNNILIHPKLLTPVPYLLAALAKRGTPQ